MSHTSTHAASFAAEIAKPRDGAVRPLRILFVTEDDPLYVFEFFDAFFAQPLPAGFDIIGLTIDRPFHEPLMRTLRRVLSLYGVRDTFRLGMRFLRARATGRSIAALARTRGIPLVATVSVNHPDYLERVRVLAPDVIVSVAGPEIFSPALLAIPRLGCINIHTGRLPAYRGMLPSFWQMLKGEPHATITIHRMAPRLDAGDVLATRDFPILPADSLDRVIRGTKREGALLMLRTLEALRAGELRGRPLDMSKAGYYRFPKPADARAFRARGHRMLPPIFGATSARGTA